MKFETPFKHDFEIPDEWWEFCEMNSFSPSGGYYPYKEGSSEVEIVCLSEIEPPQRSSGTAPFKKYKLVPVLLAFQSPECELPPVQVALKEKETQYKYFVKNGFHRFFASVAVGYKYLPVKITEHSIA
jgi:hypothetical protein